MDEYCSTIVTSQIIATCAKGELPRLHSLHLILQNKTSPDSAVSKSKFVVSSMNSLQSPRH